jgi:hypothetical protein
MSKFKVGDRVVVARKVEYAESRSCGWDECWNMDKMVGEIGEVVAAASSTGVRFNDGNIWYFLPECLELAAEENVTPKGTKDTNPKDFAASKKLPLHLVPDCMRAYAAVSFAEGASKYGAFNWRVAGVRASIYKSAMERHLMKWWNGENADEHTGVPHLASVLACVGIILDAELVGKLTDDRPPYAPMDALVQKLEPLVGGLYDLHKDIHPHHHTLQDSV